MFGKGCFDCHYCCRKSSENITLLLNQEQRKLLKEGKSEFLNLGEKKLWWLVCSKNRWSEGSGNQNSNIKNVLRIRKNFKCRSFYKYNCLIEDINAVDDELRILDRQSSKCFVVMSAIFAGISAYAAIMANIK